MDKTTPAQRRLLERISNLRGRMVKLTLTITHDGQPEVAVVEDLGRIEQLSKPSDMVGFTQKPS